MGIGRKIHNFLHPALGKVLMLHRVVEPIGFSPKPPYLEVAKDFFEEVIETFQEVGAEFIGVDQVADRIRSKTKSFFMCVTFDDGYLDTFTYAYPVLKERQIPFCVYLTRDFYQGKAKPHWNPWVEMMGEEQLLALASDPLCTIGAHTCSHPHLSQLSEEDQRREIADCKADLERLIGKTVHHFAYPYGDYNDITLRIVRELGFETGVTTSGRPVRNDSKLLELDRVSFIQKN